MAQVVRFGLSYASYESKHTAASSSQSSRWAWMLAKNCHFKCPGTPFRGQRRFWCLSVGPREVQSARLFAAPDAAVVDVVLNFLRPNCSITTITWLEHHLRIRFRTRSLFRFGRTTMIFAWKIGMIKIWRSQSDSHKNQNQPCKADSCAIRFRVSDFMFRSEKRIGMLMRSVLQSPTGNNLIWESDGPSRQNLTRNPTTRSIGFSGRLLFDLIPSFWFLFSI